LKACELSLDYVDRQGAALVIRQSMAHGYSGHVSGYEQGLGHTEQQKQQHAGGMTTAERQLRHQETSGTLERHYGGRFSLKLQASWS